MWSEIQNATENRRDYIRDTRVLQHTRLITDCTGMQVAGKPINTQWACCLGGFSFNPEKRHETDSMQMLVASSECSSGA